MPLCLMLSPPGNVLLVLIALETHTRDHLSLIFRAVNTFYEKAAVSLLLISEQTQFRKHGYGIFWSIVSLPLSEVFSGHSRKSGIRDSLVSLGNKANKPWNGYKSSYYLVLSPVGGGSPWGLGGGGFLSQLPLAVSLGKQSGLLCSLVSHYRHLGRVQWARQKTQVSIFWVSIYVTRNVINLPMSQQRTWWISVARRYGGTAWSSGPTRNRAGTTLSALAPTATWPCRQPRPATRCSSSSASSWFTACCACHPLAPSPSPQNRPGGPRIRVRHGLTSSWSPQRARAKEIRVTLALTSSSLMVGMRWRPLSGLPFVERACHAQSCPLETIWLCDWWPGGLSHAWILLGTSPRSGWVRHEVTYWKLWSWINFHFCSWCMVKGKNLPSYLKWLCLHYHWYLIEWSEINTILWKFIFSLVISVSIFIPILAFL